MVEGAAGMLSHRGECITIDLEERERFPDALKEKRARTWGCFLMYGPIATITISQMSNI